MAAEVSAALIGVGGGIITTLITVFRKEIKEMFFGTANNSFLLGTWDCEWTITSPSDDKTGKILDTVEIDNVTGNLIKGKGKTDGFGNSFLEGKATDFAVVFKYSGEGKMKDLVGGVVLKKGSPIKIDGVWCQYTSSGLLKAGETTWKKNNSFS